MKKSTHATPNRPFAQDGTTSAVASPNATGGAALLDQTNTNTNNSSSSGRCSSASNGKRGDDESCGGFVGRVLIVFFVASVLTVGFCGCYLDPSPEFISFIQTVTGTKNTAMSTLAVTTTTTATTTSAVGASSHVESTQQLQLSVAATTANTETTTAGSDAPAPAATTTTAVLNLAAFRFSSKLHMINWLQLFTDYPVSYWLCTKPPFRLLDVAFVTANLVSLMHPLFGIAAGFMIATSVVKKKKATDTENSCGSPSYSTAEAIPKGRNGTGRRSVASLSDVQAFDDEMAASDESASMMTATMGSRSYSGERAPRRACTPPAVLLLPGGGTASFCDRCGAPTTTDSLCAQCGALVSATSPTSIVAVPALVQQQAPSFKIRRNWLRIACVLFSIRNFLDTLDGTLARLHRQRRSPGVSAPTTFGLNGHTVDVATDLFGMCCCCTGMILFLWQQELTVSPCFQSVVDRIARLWNSNNNKKAAVGSLDTNSDETTAAAAATTPTTPAVMATSPYHQFFAAKCVIVAGYLYVACASGAWETFMLRYSNLFDMYANTNRHLFELENSVLVRLSQFFWSFTCGDSIFSVFILAMLFHTERNVMLWKVVQFYVFVGYVWLLLLFVFSSCVWYGVVLQDAVARAVVMGV